MAPKSFTNLFMLAPLFFLIAAKADTTIAASPPRSRYISYGALKIDYQNQDNTDHPRNPNYQQEDQQSNRQAPPRRLMLEDVQIGSPSIPNNLGESNGLIVRACKAEDPLSDTIGSECSSKLRGSPLYMKGDAKTTTFYTLLKCYEEATEAPHFFELGLNAIDPERNNTKLFEALQTCSLPYREVHGYTIRALYHFVIDNSYPNALVSVNKAVRNLKQVQECLDKQYSAMKDDKIKAKIKNIKRKNTEYPNRYLEAAATMITTLENKSK